jgi:hypothetical protein
VRVSLHILLLVLIGCLTPFGLRATEQSDQTSEPNSQTAGENNQAPEATGTFADELAQAPPVDVNRPADLHNQPNGWLGEIAAGALWSDNVERSATDHMSDTIEEAVADVAFHERSRRLDADFLSNLQFLHFGRDVYSDEVLGNFIGNVTLAIVPKFFEWVAQDNFGQQTLDPTVASTPANLENINFFSTGPNFLLTFDPLTHAQLSLRYSNVYYQLSDMNNNRADADISLIHSLSASSNVSLNVGGERVDYEDSAVNPDYTMEQAYFRYDLESRRTKVTMDLGYDQVRGLGPSGAGVLVHLDATRQLSPSMRLLLSVGQDLSDTGNLLRQLQDLNGLALNATYLQSANDPFINRYARLAWEFNHYRTVIDFDVARYEEHHLEDIGLDQGRTQTDLSVRRNLTPTIAVSIGGTYAEANYTLSAASYSDANEFAAVEWILGRRLNLRAEYDHFDQRGNAITDQFVENRISLLLGWRIDNMRAPAARPPRAPAGLSMP